MDHGIYQTSFCNRGHRVHDGRPVEHECERLSPQGLLAERAGDVDKALELFQAFRKKHGGGRSHGR